MARHSPPTQCFKLSSIRAKFAAAWALYTFTRLSEAIVEQLFLFSLTFPEIQRAASENFTLKPRVPHTHISTAEIQQKCGFLQLKNKECHSELKKANSKTISVTSLTHQPSRLGGHQLKVCGPAKYKVFSRFKVFFHSSGFFFTVQGFFQSSRFFFSKFKVFFQSSRFEKTL